MSLHVNLLFFEEYKKYRAHAVRPIEMRQLTDCPKHPGVWGFSGGDSWHGVTNRILGTLERRTNAVSPGRANYLYN